MPRIPSSQVAYAFGPGPLTFGIKVLIWTNVAMFLVTFVVPGVVPYLGLMPAAVLERLFVWQPVTYMFLHGGVMHILINMLMLWMFGTDLEHRWGTRFFLKFYFVTGVGAAATTILASLLPFGVGELMYSSLTIGASGAIYGVLVAYGLTFPNRLIYMYLLFPIPARVFVLIMAAIALLASISGGGSVAHSAHLGGLVVGYLYLKMQRGNPLAELRYRWTKMRMNQMRRRFDVHQGGRQNGGSRWVH